MNAEEEARRDRFEAVAKAEAEVSAALELARRALGRLQGAHLHQHHAALTVLKLAELAAVASVQMSELVSRTPSL